jgi:hypothetical protein
MRACDTTCGGWGGGGGGSRGRLSVPTASSSSSGLSPLAAALWSPSLGLCIRTVTLPSASVESVTDCTVKLSSWNCTHAHTHSTHTHRERERERERESGAAQQHRHVPGEQHAGVIGYHHTVRPADDV